MSRNQRIKVKYVAAGFRTDMELLFDKFFESNSNGFAEFCTVWKELQFSLIFRGKLHENEMREFVDEVYRTAVLQLRSFSLERRIAALYLLYGLYSKHPLKPKVRIRITTEFLGRLRDLLNDCKQREYSDAAYILMKLHASKAFSYVYTLGFYGPSLIKSSNARPNENSGVTAMVQELDFAFSPQIEQLKNGHWQYQEMKKALQGEEAEEVRTLSMVDDDIFRQLEDGLEKLKQDYEVKDEYSLDGPEYVD